MKGGRGVNEMNEISWEKGRKLKQRQRVRKIIRGKQLVLKWL